MSAVRSTILGLRENTVEEDDDTEDEGPPHYCDSYNEKPSLSHTPCTAEELDERGVCNKTQLCAHGQRKSHCFMSWRNDSGVVKIINSGCWLHYGDCKDATDECRTDNNTAKSGIYYCCCNGNLCNRQFYLDPATDVIEPDVEPATYNQWMILVYVLVPLLAICAVIVISFWCYRHHKGGFDDMDRVSVDTPATGATQCTTVSSFPQHEMSLPHLIDVKARGRFGKVWRAQLHDRIVAVKTFDQTEKLSWQNEQDIFLTPLMTSHDNILKFLTASKRGEELWLITEFFERGSLADYIKSHTLTFSEVLRIMKTMASGMSFLHEDTIKDGDYKPAIAHRDFKSKNVLLDSDLNAIIADFGLAVKFTPGESPGESHGQVGTLRYMAPEVLEGAINFQKDSFLRIDMYAFGLVMWEILCRCSEFSDIREAFQPFEEELGPHPSMEHMQDYVVERKMRPGIKEEWRRLKSGSMICETMEECWDHDAEARLSAGCVELRIAGLQGQRALIEPIANEIHGVPLIVAIPPDGQVSSNVEAMNQRNIQMSNLSRPTENFQDKNVRAVQSGQLGSQADPNHENNRKEQTELYVRYDDDDDQDSGTFANEDTLSHDGVMEQLLDTDDSGNVPTAVVIGGNEDPATVPFLADERESQL